MPDLGLALGPQWSGRPGILFGDHQDTPTASMDEVLTHELVHHWLRQSGATEPRWVLVEGHADNQPALIQEGLANFVAAARSGDPVIARAAGPHAATSLRVFARCPDHLHGEAHDDSLVLSGALWEAREALPADLLLGAIAQASARRPACPTSPARSNAPQPLARGRAPGPRSPPDTASTAATSPCALTPGERLSASREGFVIPAPSAFTPPPPHVTSPQAFALALPPGTPSVGLTLRANRKDAATLEVQWRAPGQADTREAAPLAGWPIATANLAVPPGATELIFRLASKSPDELTFNDLRVTPTAPAPSAEALTAAVVAAPSAPPPSCAGCAATTADTLLWAAVIIAWFLRRNPLAKAPRAR
ncbi:MAG: hypothetical protein R3F39_23280 [Myxococcota bacterium]